jgi:transcriptional regulator with XRE-family HTH domain
VWHRNVPTRPSQTDPEQRARWERIRRSVGERIRKIRLEKGLTQEALALEAGISRNVLIEVEHGRIGLLYERLFDIAAVLDVEVSSLIDD